MQTLGAWLRHPAWAIVLPIPLFVIGHDYSWLGLLDVAVFALLAAALTWRSGGLELAIGMHVVNNVFALSAGALGLADMNATEFSATAAAFSIGYTVITAGMLLLLNERRRRTVSSR